MSKVTTSPQNNFHAELGADANSSCCVSGLRYPAEQLAVYPGKLSQPQRPPRHPAASLYRLQSVLYQDDIAFGIYTGRYFITSFSRKATVTLQQKPCEALCSKGPQQKNANKICIFLDILRRRSCLEFFLMKSSIMPLLLRLLYLFMALLSELAECWGV